MCCKIFPLQHFKDIRNMCAELDHESLDFLIMGQLMSNTSISSKTHHHIQPPDERQRVSTAYYHQGIKVCYYNDTNMKYTHVHNILVYISIPFIKVCKKNIYVSAWNRKITVECYSIKSVEKWN